MHCAFHFGDPLAAERMGISKPNLRILYIVGIIMVR
jgi:hypothetical protein